MPQVPSYAGPSVRDAPLGINPLSTPDLGANGARALANGLDQVADGAMQVVQRDAETQANQADIDISSGWLQWDAEARRKYQGANIGEYETEAKKWWTDQAQAYGPALGPLAKAKLGQSLMRKQAAALGNVAQHVNGVKERTADEAAEGALQNSIQFGVTSGDLAGAAGEVKKLVSEFGARKGWGTDQVVAEQSKRLGSLHLAAIAQMADGDAEKAQAYYLKNKAEIPFTAQATVEKTLKGELDNQGATRNAALWAELPYGEQLKKAGEVNDPQLREKTLLQIKNNQGQIAAARQGQERAQADKAWQLVGQGQRVPELVLSAMDGKERVQLQDYLRARAEHAADQGSKPVKTNPLEHARLLDMMLNDPEGFKRERIAASAMKLSSTDLEQFAAKQQAMREGSGKQDSMFTDEQRIDTSLARAGIDPKKKPDDAYAVRTEIDRRVRAESAAKGGKGLSADEKQRVIDNVFADKVFTPGFFGNKEKPLSLVKPEDLKDAYVVIDDKRVPVSTVPATDRVQIIQARKARGLPVSEQSIVETYLKAKNATRTGSY